MSLPLNKFLSTATQSSATVTASLSVTTNSKTKPSNNNNVKSQKIEKNLVKPVTAQKPAAKSNNNQQSTSLVNSATITTTSSAVAVVKNGSTMTKKKTQKISAQTRNTVVRGEKKPLAKKTGENSTVDSVNVLVNVQTSSQIVKPEETSPMTDKKRFAIMQTEVLPLGKYALVKVFLRWYKAETGHDWPNTEQAANELCK